MGPPRDRLPEVGAHVDATNNVSQQRVAGRSQRLGVPGCRSRLPFFLTTRLEEGDFSGRSAVPLLPTLL